MTRLVALGLILSAAGLFAQQKDAATAACTLDGPVVTSDRTLPPVPKTRPPSFPLDPLVGSGLLPDRNTTFHVRIRISEQGRVTSGCVLEDAKPKLAEMIVGEMRNQWTYHPARLDQADVAVAVTVPYEIVRAAPWKKDEPAPDQLRPGTPAQLLVRVSTSTDVAWLRQIAASYEGAARALGLRRIAAFGRVRPFRTAAFARLGELGTADSLQAADEIERAMAPVKPAADRFSATVWQHPAWHFGDAPVAILAQAASPDGVTYGVTPGDLFGDWELFLTWSRTPADRESWARPRPIPGTLHRGINNTFLHWLGDGRLEFTYEQEQTPPQGIMEFRAEGERAAPSPRPKSWVISIPEVLADTDGDGWTDLEEERLGIDPSKSDTDGDGLDDGSDTCPNNPVAWGDEISEEQLLLRKALFAVFSLSGARCALFPEAGTPPVHLRGYGGPVIYGRSRRPVTPGTFGSFGGVFVRWEIVNRTAEEATVIISDWEGSLAAGGQNVYLRKQRGRWYVIGTKTTWIS